MFRKKCEETVFFSRFSRHFEQNLPKMQKRRYWSILHDVPQKLWESSVLSRSSWYFVQSSHIWQENKQRFLIICTMFCKKYEKQCLILFRNTLYKFFFFSFLHDVPRKVRENSVFSRFLWHFVQSSHKMLANVAQKSHKTLFSCILYELCTKCHEKLEKNCFSTVFAERHLKSWKNAVFCILCELCT